MKCWPSALQPQQKALGSETKCAGCVAGKSASTFCSCAKLEAPRPEAHSFTSAPGSAAAGAMPYLSATPSCGTMWDQVTGLESLRCVHNVISTRAGTGFM